MKSLIVLGLLLSILLAQQVGPVVQYVSGSPNTISNPIYSSLRGGKLIYIKVTGHSLMASENLVFVGTTPCKIPSDGVTDTFISCETTDIGSDTDINSQSITVISNSVAQTTRWPNVVHFSSVATPVLNELFPTSGYANKQVNYLGIHRIADLGNDRVLGDIKELKLGEHLCTRFDIFQEAINPHANQYIKCIQSSLQEAGKYKVTQKVTPGRATNSPNLLRASLEQGEQYEFAVLPTITSISPNTGNLGGQNITITGTGFSNVPKNNSVSVNGNDCRVTSSSENTITCTLDKYDSTKTAKLTTTSSSQQNGYFSGAGLKYTRYGALASNSMDDFVDAVRISNATFLGTPQQVGVRAQLKEGNVYGSGVYAQAWSGYFTAPADGTYVFRGNADDAFSFFLASVPGSAELPTTPLIYSNSYQPNWNNFYLDDSQYAENTATLSAGKSYYLQAYHLNTGGGGNFRIEVDIPNSNTNLPFQAYQIHKLSTQTTVQPEVVRYTMTGAISGQINLKLVRKDKTGATIYNVNKTVTYGCSASSFQNALNGFNSFSSFFISVTRNIFDSANNPKVDFTETTDIIRYDVSIYKKRPVEYENQNFIVAYINCPGSITKQGITEHSPLLSGSFSFTIGGQPFNQIPYNSSAASIQTSLRTIVGFQRVAVDSVSKYGAEYSTTWVIRYIGVHRVIPAFVPNAVGLTGGTTSPTVDLTIRRAYSSRITFSPIDFRFLNTAASKANVLVKTNQIPALCVGNCEYTFFDKFRITSLSRSGATLSLAISNPTNIAVTQTQVSILVQGLPCTITGTFDLSALSCTLTKNSDNTPLLIAGSVTPLVFIAPHGIIGLDDGVTFTGRRLLLTVNPIVVPLVTTSLSRTTGGDNGGYLNTISGSGFPLQKSQIKVNLCGKDAVIQDVSNIQVIFYVASCATLGSSTVTVTVGQSTSNTLSYTYTSGSSSAPVIQSLSPNTLNPALKKVMTITGSGFGTNIANVFVYLSNSTGKIYSLKVLTLTDTMIKVGLSGGLPGIFTVQVSLPGSNGDSVPATVGADQFSYVVSITSVSPATGSYYGGTLLTINGINFSPAYSDTLAYVGDALSNFCNIETITQTQITCRTPQIHRLYTAGDQQKLMLETKLIVPSTCPGNNCNFVYMAQADSPKLSTISKKTANAEAIILTGLNFVHDVTCSVSMRSKSNDSIVIEVPTATCDDVSANFTIPRTVSTGIYLVRVRNEIGQSNGLQITVNWNIGSSSFASGGSIMGNRATYSGGSGYPKSLGDGYNVYLLSSNSNVYPIELISCCTDNTLVFEIPPIPDGLSLSIVFQSPFSMIRRAYRPQFALTPNISIAAGAAFTPGVQTVTFTRIDTITSSPILAIKLVSTIDKKSQIAISDWTIRTTTTFTFSADLKSGSYNIMALTKHGYCLADRSINVSLASTLTAPAQTTSFAGGLITITGSNLSPSSYILVNNLRGNVKTHTSSAVTYEVPALVTPLSQSTFNLKKVQQLNMRSFTYSSDQSGINNNVSAAFDGQIRTIYGSPNAVCWIQVDVGSGLQAVVDRVRFFPFLNWVNTANYTLDGVFEASNDDSTWTLLGKIDQTVHSGWNVIKSKTLNPFRYFRFRHTSQSQCNLAQFQLYGYVISQITAVMSSQMSNVIYNDGFNTQTLTNKVEYKQVSTPTVASVNPPYGDIFGGYQITITGTNLNSASTSVLIDSVPCVYVSSTATELVCTVGARPAIPSKNTFQVSINGNKAVILNTFLYVLKWSDSRTWGVDAPPVEGDLVYVPPGMTLLIDQDTPILLGIAVEKGTLIFPNDTSKAITVRTGFITLNGGAFIAGTESAPLYSNLTFIMYGDYYGKQQPMFGNKGIGCMDCKFSMYGRPRKPTWTTISATINPGDSTLTVTDDVDWKVGQTIVVAATSFYHYEAEERKITAISGKTITVDTAFNNKHVSVVQNLGSKDKLTMRAEVGLLSRNIKMMGDPTSVIGKYGSHLMLSGMTPDGLEGQVAYSEFTHCGQPQILGRYCIHFHMAKQVPTSFVRGNAVHQSFARVVTIHGVYRLTVEDNVGYRVRGHNFFIQDGIETHNTIRNNLAISSLAVTNMLQTDTSVASFWVTNPTNDFYGNHAAGGDFYGFWYEIKPNPDGPSATNDVCPTGNPLGYVANNVAHSYIRFGLRVFQLYSRRFPCRPIRNDSIANDPWAANPSIPSIFYNFTIYKNLQAGVLSEESGNIQFQNFTIAQNYRAGVQFYFANFTREMVSVDNSIIVGKTVTNPSVDGSNYTKGMAAVITPRTGQANITNTRFYYYPAGSIALITCSHCDDLLLYTNLGSDTFIKNLTFTGVVGKYLLMIGLKRDVIYDLDGSLSDAFDGGDRSSATIVSNFAHIGTSNNDACLQSSTPSAWDDAYMCDQTVTIRRVFFTNLIDPYVFNTQFMKVFEISSIEEVVDPELSSDLYTAVKSLQGTMQPKKQKPKTWSLPFITGKMYQIWWGTGLDFTHLSIESSRSLKQEDKGIIFKFNYTQNRESFRIGPMRGGVKLTPLDYITRTGLSTQLTPQTCTNGQFYHNNDDSSLRMLEICISGKGKTLYEYMEVNGVVCEHLCPAPPGTFIKEDFIRLWSNATQWPDGKIPKAGDNVTVNGSWTVLLDIDPEPANYMIIDGTVIADDTRDIFLTARSIFIRSGNITAGTSTNPFQHKFTIQINNTKQDHGWFIDEIVAGNKYLVVSGSLNLYGNAPETVKTFLTKSASVNDDKIFVKSSSEWAIGDTLGISPSYGNYAEYEQVTITAINIDEGSVSISPPLKFNHYGSDGPLTAGSYGKIDVNTYVAHLNRNIKIIPGPDVGWGVNVLVYGYLDQDDVRRDGSVRLSGIQIQDGGQYDTTSSALQFLNVQDYSSLVEKTSFINCKAWCINVDTVKNVTITNNVFYNAWVFGIRALSMVNFEFTDNLLIGVTARPTVPYPGELVACFASYNYVNPADKVKVSNNLCLGSQGHGFAVPHIRCSELQTNPFRDNTVGSAQIGYIFNNIETPDGCKGFSYAKAYACQIGQICGPSGSTSIHFDNFIMVDNQRGVTLKMGGSEGKTNHTGLFTNSYVSAVSRPTCAQCYGAGAIKCSNSIGVRAFSATANGQSLPKKFGGGFDVICKQELYEAKAYLTNITFDNFNQAYTNAQIQSKCKQNFVFRPHAIAHAATGDHNLFDVHCVNCDENSYLYGEMNSLSNLGWFGGCGDMVCTGKSNYLITDWDGTFLGFKGTIIPNNTAIGNNEPGCVPSVPMNSHICARTDFATLAYQSIAPDFNTRIMWPVNLTYDGSNYTTVTNGWREWQWDGKEPLNKRFGRFLSIIKLNSTYNMTYRAMPPVKMQFQIQKRKPAGDNNNYIIAKMHYPLPNMIQAKVNGVVKDPILITDSGLKRSLDTKVCGDNVYFYTNYTTHFVITEDKDCLVELSLTETIQLTTHFAMNVNDFFTNNKLTSFISNLCALLGITDTSRVKVVGVVDGSTIVHAAIIPPAAGSTDPSLPTVQATLTNNQQTVMAGLTTNVGTVLTVSSSLHADPSIITPEQETMMENNVGMIVGISVGAVVLGITIAVVFCYFLRKRAKIVEQIRQSEESHAQKEGDKDNYILNHESHFDAKEATSEFKIVQGVSSKVNVKHHQGYDD